MPQDFTVHIKIWIEKNGESILGPGRLSILQAIERTGSLTKAAKECNISFRKAWKLINEINEKLSQPVIYTERGGQGGGGSTKLTEFGKKLVMQYNSIYNKLEALANDPNLWTQI